MSRRDYGAKCENTAEVGGWQLVPSEVVRVEARLTRAEQRVQRLEQRCRQDWVWAGLIGLAFGMALTYALTGGAG